MGWDAAAILDDCGASVLGLFSSGASSLVVFARRCRTPVLREVAGARVETSATAEDMGAEAALGGMGALGAWPPNIRASKSATTTRGRRRCISSPSSELEEELGESTICCDLFDLEEVSVSTATALVPAGSTVSESE